MFRQIDLALWPDAAPCLVRQTRLPWGVARRLMDLPSVTNFSNRRGFSGAKIRLWQVFANINVLAVNLAYIVCAVSFLRLPFPIPVWISC